MEPRRCRRGNAVDPLERQRQAQASMEPRRCRRGNTHGVLGSLQRHTLQWSRVVADAETEEHDFNTFSADSLQWSRVVADAETVDGLARRDRGPSFNGAAS